MHSVIATDALSEDGDYSVGGRNRRCLADISTCGGDAHRLENSVGGTESSRRDTGCKATTYWQTTPNWKKTRFRNLLFSPDFHRGTHLGCVTRSRDSWASSRLLGSKRAGVSPAIRASRFTSIVANPYIPVPNKQGPPAGTDGLVRFETGCGTRLSRGGHQDSQRVSEFRRFAVPSRPR